MKVIGAFFVLGLTMVKSSIASRIMTIEDYLMVFLEEKSATSGVVSMENHVLPSFTPKTILL
jgi:hypothetical protein